MSTAPRLDISIKSSTTLTGASLWLGWAAWAGIAVLTVIVAGAGFEALFSGNHGLVDSQGPLALQPGVAQELEQRMFDLRFLEMGQRTVHVAGLLLFAGTAFLIVARGPRDWVILLSSATLLTSGAAMFVPSSVLASTDSSWNPAVEVLGVFDAGPEFWRSIAGVAIVLFALLFPDGRFTTAWTRILAWVIVVEVVLWTAFPGVAVFDVARWPEVLRIAWTLGIGVALVVAQLERYFWHSTQEVRRQTRLVVISLSSAVATLALIWILSPDLSRNVDLGLVLVTDRLQAIYDLNLLSLLTVSVILLPVSIGVSVARYRLFDMDLILNRALVYATLTGVIAAALFGGVAAAGSFIVDRFGRGLGIAMTGILIVALFQPLRTRVQSQIDRRFYHEKYDADRTVAAFAERIRDEADIDTLERDLLLVVNETMKSEDVRIFLHRDADAHSAEHTSLADLYLAEPNRPLDTAEGGSENELLARLADNGVEVVLPLVSHHEIVAVLELGRRLVDRPYAGLDHQLLRQLAESAAPAIRYAQLADQHAKEAVAKERYQQELVLARTIQRDLLPKERPELPGWEIDALYEPAREVGGDLYDFVELGDGRWAVIVADVTDKGVPAAMVMATCRSMLRGVATGPDRPRPGEVLRRVNELLIPDTPDNMFVTAFYAVIDPESGVVSYANAGHCLPLLWSEDSVVQIEARGMPLGLLAEMEYEEGDRTIEPGENLLLYSDGVTEAHDQNGEMFGTERLRRWVAGRNASQDLLTDLMSELNSFVDPAEDLGDDVTLVALRRDPTA